MLLHIGMLPLEVSRGLLVCRVHLGGDLGRPPGQAGVYVRPPDPVRRGLTPFDPASLARIKDTGKDGDDNVLAMTTPQHHAWWKGSNQDIAD